MGGASGIPPSSMIRRWFLSEGSQGGRKITTHRTEKEISRRRGCLCTHPLEEWTCTPELESLTWNLKLHGFFLSYIVVFIISPETIFSWYVNCFSSHCDMLREELIYFGSLFQRVCFMSTCFQASRPVVRQNIRAVGVYGRGDSP